MTLRRLAAFSLAAGLAFPLGADLAADLATAPRSEADRERDAGRKPAEVLSFLGIGPGMTVMDLIASGGWYTEVLSVAVGPGGTVYAQNPPIMLNFRDGYYDKAMSARLADNRLPNVTRLDRNLDQTGLPPNSLDAAITALNFHDIYNGSGAAVAAGFLDDMMALIKPGGVLGLIDHRGAPGNDNVALHRLELEAAMPLIENSGFVVTSSALLRNPGDDLTLNVFDEAIRGSTDRILLRLVKPAEEAVE